ncbi:hypothetical protein H4582DRAFT_1982860 [Lactarius indigo]|nr:hypothetical protein H4582DRAFT_1982860 [Lactarius indigo]
MLVFVSHVCTLVEIACPVPLDYYTVLEKSRSLFQPGHGSIFVAILNFSANTAVLYFVSVVAHSSCLGLGNSASAISLAAETIILGGRCGALINYSSRYPCSKK